jgi:hypothetical protein
MRLPKKLHKEALPLLFALKKSYERNTNPELGLCSNPVLITVEDCELFKTILKNMV